MEIKFELDWGKGHPEERDATKQNWTVIEWMNHAADKAADAEYAGRRGRCARVPTASEEAEVRMARQSSNLGDRWR